MTTTKSDIADGTLSVGFLESEDASRPLIVTVRDLVRVLDAFQSVVYVMAAYELDLPSVRNLSDDQRRQFALAVLGYRHGSLWTDLAPGALLLAHEISQRSSLFTAEILQDLAKDQVKLAVETIGQSVEAMIKQFRGVQQDPRLDRGIGPHTASIARTALNRGHDIEIIDKEPNGAEHILRTTYAGNVRVLSRDAVLRGKLEQFDRCVVRDIMTSQPVIKAQVPAFNNALVRCEYERGREREFAGSLRVGEPITIVGTPTWSERKADNFVPDVIEIVVLLGSNGDIIGSPALGQLLLEGSPDDEPAA